MHIEFTIPGAPFGKERPRITVRGGFGHAYTPKKTVDYEKGVRSVAMGKVLKTPGWDAEAPMAVRIVAYYPIPASYTKKKRQAVLEGKLHPTVKPDLDNVCKSILDAMNGVVYNDDKQIIVLYGEKHYAKEDPNVAVIVKTLL